MIFVLQNVAKTPGVYKKAQGHSAGATKTFDIKNMLMTYNSLLHILLALSLAQCPPIKVSEVT